MSSEKTEASPPDGGDSRGGEAAKIVETVGTRVENGLERVLGQLSATTVFGKPEKVGDRLVITAAAVQRGGGFGFGGGTGNDVSVEKTSGGGGGGGGGGGDSRPVAVIEVSPDGVTVRPVFDFTRIGVTLITGLLATWKLGKSPAPPFKGRLRGR